MSINKNQTNIHDIQNFKEMGNFMIMIQNQNNCHQKLQILFKEPQFIHL